MKTRPRLSLEIDEEQKRIIDELFGTGTRCRAMKTPVFKQLCDALIKIIREEGIDAVYLAAKNSKLQLYFESTINLKDCLIP